MTNVHFIGIGGAGLSAMATVLLQQGEAVSGSDMQASEATARLAALGARVCIGHRAENLGAAEQVVISSAIPAENPELLAARQQGLPVAKRAEWLGRMMAGRVGIGIAGTHGKTTTTAMTAFIIKEAGLDPTFIVGGFVPQMGTNAAAGQGPAFIIEADEYDHTFLGLRPTVAVVTIVEWDHPDIFPTPKEMCQAFVDFVQLVPAAGGRVIGCGDAPGVRDILTHAHAPAVTYGLEAGNDWQAINLRLNERGGYDFEVVRFSSPVVQVSLRVPGQHNVANGLAALACAESQGVAVSQAAESLSRFEGVGRRFELKGEVNGVTVIDDYAHHPTEIKATLAAARVRFGARPIWALFQPHTFSRTVALRDDFAEAFGDADHVVLVDIFPSREKDEGLVTSRDILEQMSHPDARYIGPLLEAGAYLDERLRPGDVLLTLGAGDIYRVGELIVKPSPPTPLPRGEGRQDGERRPSPPTPLPRGEGRQDGE
jgi:UDP-N-acetylmuramate--alanine ligase